MGYDSMAAWDRIQVFQFNDDIRMRLVAAAKPLLSTCLTSRRSGGIWQRSIDVRSREGRTLSRDDYDPPRTPLQPTTPSFADATSSWSPSQSPRTMSVRSSPTSSPLTSPRLGITHHFPPSIPTSLPASAGDSSRLADKLYAAACAGDVDHIDLLLGLGASIDTGSLVEGLYTNFKPAKSGRLSPLAGAAGHGQRSAVEYLLARGAFLNPDVNQSSSAPLHEACRHNDVAMARVLLEAGADVDFTNCYNTTPLMYSIKYGSTALVSLLLAYKPDLNKISFIGAAAIHWAVWPGRADVMRLIIQAGADVNHMMQTGSNPLHCAATGGQFYIVKCLLQHGADFTMRDQDNSTPLQIAEQSEHSDIAGLIREAMAGRI